MAGGRRRAGRIVVIAALILIGVWLLFALVFPWVDRRINDPVLGTAHATADAVDVSAPPLGADA